MDSERFDALTRTLRSRRTAVSALLGGVTAVLGLAPEEGAAHNAARACRKVAARGNRRRCQRRAWSHNRSCHPETAPATCRGRCGAWPNRCGKAVSCAVCPTPKSCLGNGSCGQACTGPICPTGCGCYLLPSVEGPRYCAPNGLVCANFTQACTATSDCPLNHACMDTGCGGGSSPIRCVPLCQG